MYIDDRAALEVMSVFEFEYDCTASHKPCTYKTMIEPLAFFLRHPLALCSTAVAIGNITWPEEMYPNALMKQDYLWLQANSGAASSKNTYLDLGALVRGGQGQDHFILREYENKGLTFDRMLLWEAEQVGGEVIFRHVPKRWHYAYQFFNVPVTGDVSAPEHPLNVLEKVHKDASFMVRVYTSGITVGVSVNCRGCTNLYILPPGRLQTFMGMNNCAAI